MGSVGYRFSELLVNSFTTKVTADGFVETLIYEGKKYVKPYVWDDTGYHGTDLAWKYEDDLPDELVRVLEDQDPAMIMSVLFRLREDNEGDNNEEDL